MKVKYTVTMDIPDRYRFGPNEGIPIDQDVVLDYVQGALETVCRNMVYNKELYWFEVVQAHK